MSNGDIEVVMTGSGDADLYVSKGAEPNDGDYDCRPYLNGSDERCTETGPGAFYVSVQGYSTQGSDFSLSITFVGDDVAPSPATEGATDSASSQLNESGTLALGDMSYYTLEVTAGQTVTVKTQAEADIDVYVKMHQAPTTAAYDKRGYTASGNEKVVYTPSVAGTLHVMVHGYAASDFSLTTSAE